MKEITIILLSTCKFALAFPLAAYGMNMSFAEIILYTNLGGLIGVLFFTFLSNKIILFWDKCIRPSLKIKRKPNPKFSKRRRKFISIKNKYGFPGIIILNPIVLSIPISTFLIVKYYGRKKRYLLWLVIGQMAWSLVYTIFYLYIRNDILRSL